MNAHTEAEIPAAAAKSNERILVVDDTAANVKLLDDLLAFQGYEIETASSGDEALAAIHRRMPDLVLLDVLMPGMSGYDVCRAIRAEPAIAMLPVVMVTTLDDRDERVRGIESGADDFLSRPVNPPELLARVRSLLRIRRLHETVQRQKEQLLAWNRTLEARVAEEVSHVEKLQRLKRFFSPQLAELILAGGADDPLESHRRDVTVVFLDLRGFTAFSETSEPEEVMSVLREYHAAMGQIILEHEGLFVGVVRVEHQVAFEILAAQCADVRRVTLARGLVGAIDEFGHLHAVEFAGAGRQQQAGRQHDEGEIPGHPLRV